jgi:hypothetical protein
MLLCSGCGLTSYIFLLVRVFSLKKKGAIGVESCVSGPLDQCFLIARPRPGTRPWHQLYWALVLSKKEFTGPRAGKG